MNLDEATLGALIAAFVRGSALAVTAPVIGDTTTPIRARLVFVIAVAIGVGLNRPGVPLAELPMVVALELASGLITGATARFVLAKVAVAGQLIGLSLGLGFASAYDPGAQESAGTMRTLLATIAGLAFLGAGGLESIVRSVAASPASITDIAMMGPQLVRAATSAFGHGLALAGPIVLAALVANIGLAVMNRAAPAVNVFSISLSAVLILGGIVLVATSGTLFGGIADAANRAVAVFSG
jgi:flagellar biosynthesis protein FliR